MFLCYACIRARECARRSMRDDQWCTGVRVFPVRVCAPPSEKHIFLLLPIQHVVQQSHHKAIRLPVLLRAVRDTLRNFFDITSPDECSTLRTVCSDRSGIKCDLL